VVLIRGGRVKDLRACATTSSRRARHAGREGPQTTPLLYGAKVRSNRGRFHMARRRAQIAANQSGRQVWRRCCCQVHDSLMYDGKKSAAEGIMYGAFDVILQKTKQDPVQVFHEALRNVSPALEVRSRLLVAPPTVPVEVRTDRSRALAIRWIITASRARNEPTMTGRLSGEILDAASNPVMP